jgi:hypothetical protein
MKSEAFTLGYNNALAGEAPDRGYRFDGNRVERVLVVAGHKAGRVEMGASRFPVLFYSGDKADYWIVSDEPTFQATPKGSSKAPGTTGGYPNLESLFRLKNETLRG